jgi:DNA-binding NtrC family response regulator
MRDITGDVSARQRKRPVAEAVFFSGQRLVSDNRAENDLDATLEAIRRGWESRPRWSLLFLDLHFKTGVLKSDGTPKGRAADRDPTNYFGLTILEALWEDPVLRDIPVVITSSMEREPVEERFAHHGVFSFVDKVDITPKRVRDLLLTYGLIPDEPIRGQDLQAAPGSSIRTEKSRPKIIGRSVSLLKSLREARRRAQLQNDNILVLGESGTGKELISRYIHEQAAVQGAFIPVFIPGGSDTLVADLLFGHVKGAFTGAVADRPGPAELADKGTLFIDEFGDITPSVQSKLLRLLDKNIRETQRLGSNDTIEVDLQVVLATNRLDILFGDDFRGDLLARTGARDPVTLPPLRKRAQDVPLLVEHFVRTFERKHNAQRREVPEEALDLIRAYEWPGNIRELATVLEQAVHRYKDLGYLSSKHLNLEDRMRVHSVPAEAPPEHEQESDTVERTIHEESTSGLESGIDLESLTNTIHHLDVDALRRADVEGALIPLHRAYYGLLLRLLDRSLDETRELSNQRFEYTNAVRLLVGGDEPLENFNSTDARRYIKRILKFDEKLDTQLNFLTDFISELPNLRAFLDEKAPRQIRDVLQERRDTDRR